MRMLFVQTKSCYIKEFDLFTYKGLLAADALKAEKYSKDKIRSTIIL